MMLLLLLAVAAQQGMITNSPASQPAVVVGPATPRIVAPQPPQPQVVRPPQERGTAQSLFSPDDYPPAAGDGRRGAVAVMLTVDPQGRVTGCEVARSSGSAALDIATCNLLRRRERFTPAMDSNGNPAVGRVPVQIDWDAVFRDVRVIRGN